MYLQSCHPHRAELLIANDNREGNLQSEDTLLSTPFYIYMQGT